MSTIQFLVYCQEPPKTFTGGLLGSIELHVIHLLLAGGKTLIEENYSGTDPVGWYTQCLEDQGMTVQSSRLQTYKGQTIVWLQIDHSKLKIEEYTLWTEVEEGDMETLAWRTVWYPCSAETKQECLGLAVVAKEVAIQSRAVAKNPLTLQQVLTAIVQQTP